ncbi:MAG: hypothetical protein GX542_10330 [Rhodococcus sp.]|nr:hypothetical protein [Rhodococcus sp. (in: high G+C Gram-positive bacteria)]
MTGVGDLLDGLRAAIEADIKKLDLHGLSGIVDNTAPAAADINPTVENNAKIASASVTDRAPEPKEPEAEDPEPSKDTTTSSADDHVRGYLSGLRAARMCVIEEQSRHAGLWAWVDRAPSAATRRSRKRTALARVRRRLDQKRSAVNLTLVRDRGFQDAMAHAMALVEQAAERKTPSTVDAGVTGDAENGLDTVKDLDTAKD